MYRVYPFALMIILLLVACGPTDTNQEDPIQSLENQNPTLTAFVFPGESATESSYPIESSESGYPANEEPIGDLGYPVNDSTTNTDAEAYPAPGRIVDEAKRFSFQDVISAGLEEITGSGYPNTAIKIISISHAGEVLGSGSTDDSGQFRIILNRPVEKGELVGILLGEGIPIEDFIDAPGSDIPLIGFVLVQQLVE